MIHYVAPSGEGMLPIRGALNAARPLLAGRLRRVSYEQLARRVTPETRLVWRAIRRSFWLRWLAKRPWFPVKLEALHAGATRISGAYRAAGARTLPGGTYIFTAFDQLSPRDAEVAARVWQAIAETHPGTRLLNHPTRSLRRYELLRVLHDRGINRFDASRVSERRWPARYPVFLRDEHAHGGWKSPLLRDRAALEEALEALDREGRSRDATLIVEFVDTADGDGLYRKYSAYRVGPQMIPGAMLFSRHWVLNSSDILDAPQQREILQYREANPHADRLREIFELGRIEYGRIDYALLDGEIQVWEINTNPMLGGRAAEQGTFRGENSRDRLRRLAEAFRALDAGEA